MEAHIRLHFHNGKVVVTENEQAPNKMTKFEKFSTVLTQNLLNLLSATAMLYLSKNILSLSGHLHFQLQNFQNKHLFVRYQLLIAFH